MDLNFDIDTDYVGTDFLQSDIRVGDRRHIVCGTQDMLGLLGQCKTWYVDSTFKVVKSPFTQLFSIHGFIRSGDCIKQVPMVFVIMSGKSKKDYRKVFQAILDLLSDSKVNRLVMDFEYAMGHTADKVFPEVSVRGCGFHWSQAVFRQPKDGTKAAFIKDEGTHVFVKKLLALPYLPAEEILAAFTKLTEQQPLSHELQSLVDFVRSNWIDTTRFPPSKWLVYNCAVRTNNDLEGYHHKLNSDAEKPNLPFYLQIDLLKKECQDVSITMRLISNHETKKIQRKQYHSLQGKIIKAWKSHENVQLTGKQLLQYCAHLTPY